MLFHSWVYLQNDPHRRYRLALLQIWRIQIRSEGPRHGLSFLIAYTVGMKPNSESGHWIHRGYKGHLWISRSVQKPCFRSHVYCFPVILSHTFKRWQADRRDEGRERLQAWDKSHHQCCLVSLVEVMQLNLLCFSKKSQTGHLIGFHHFVMCTTLILPVHHAHWAEYLEHEVSSTSLKFYSA